jgi:hypothetical protein
MANDRRVGSLLVQMRAELGGLKLDVKEMQSTFTNGFNQIKSAAASLAGSLGAALSVGAIIAYGKSIIDLGSQLSDLSAQSGISAQTLSGIKSTIEENGGSLDGFIKSLTKAQSVLGSTTDESDATAIALKNIGLSVKEAQRLAPEQFLERIAKGLASISDQNNRIATAKGLLGRGGAENVPALIAMADQFDRLKAGGLSQETVKALDDIGDSFTRLSNTLKNLTAGPLASFLTIMIKGIDMLGQFSDEAKLLVALIDVQGQIEAIDKTMAARKSMRESGFGFFTGKNDEEMLQRRKAALELELDLAAKLGQLNKQPAKPLTGGGVNLGSGKDANAAAEALRKLQAEGLKSLFAEIDKGQEEAVKAGQAILDLGKSLDSLRGTETEREMAAINQQFDEMKLKATEAAAATGQGLEGMLAGIEFQRRQALLAKQPLAAGAANFDFLDAEAGAGMVQNAQRLQEIGRILQTDLPAALRKATEDGQLFGNTFDVVGAQMTAVREAINNLREQGLAPLSPEIQNLKAQFDNLATLGNIEQSFRSLAGSITSAFDQTLSGIMQGTQTFGQGITNLFRNIALSIANTMLKTALNPISSWLGGVLGGLLGAGFKGIAGLFGNTPLAPVATVGPGAIPGLTSGFFAEGGIVTRPTLSLMGESGPEAIIPLSKMNGGGFGNGGTHITIENLDARGAQRGVSAEIMRAIAMSENRAVDRSVGEVKNERRRSNNFARAF